MSAKEDLQKLIADIETQQFREKETGGLMNTMSDKISKELAPLFSAHSKEITSKMTDAVISAVKGLKIDVPKIDAPQVNIPAFPEIPAFPQMKAPIVNVPAPIVNVPAPIVNVRPTEVNFPNEMSLKPGARPFPVVMMDLAGKPMNFSGLSGGATGGKSDFFTIVGITNTVGVVTINPDGNATYSSSSAGGASSSIQIIDSSNNVVTVANPFPVQVVSGGTATSAVNIVDSSGVAYSGTNPMPTTATATLSAAIGQGDSASALRTIQAGDSVSSVVVNSGTITTVTSITNSVGTVLTDSSGVAYSGSNPVPTTASVTLSAAVGQGDSASALRTIQAGDSVSSVVVNSGTITTVTSITNSVGTVLTDSSGVAYSGSNPVPTTASVTLSAAVGQGDGASALRTIQAGDSVSSVVVNSGTITTVTTLTGITNSVATVLTDSGGIAYSGSNPVPTTATISLPFGQGDTATATRVVQAGDSVSSVIVNSGTITTVTGITNSLQVALIDSSGIQYSGSNPVPVVFGASGTQAVNLVDSSGVAYSGSNAVPVTGTIAAVTNITNSIAAVLLDESGAVWQPFTYGPGEGATAQRVILANDNAYSFVVNSGTVTAVTSITNSVAAASVDSSGVQYSGANPFPFTLAASGGANTINVSLVDSGGVGYSGSNPLPTTASVSLTLPSGPGDGATATRFIQAGDTVSSINVLQINGTTPTLLSIAQGDSTSALRVIQAGDSVSSVVVNSGTITTVTTLTGVTNSIAVVSLDRDGNPLTTGPIGAGDGSTALRVLIAGDSPSSVVVNSGTITTVTGITNTVNVRLDTPDGTVSQANPFPVAMVSGGLDSTIVMVAHTALPAAKSDGADVRPMADKYGRQVHRPIQVRDLTATAYVSLTTGTEATLLAASAGALYDLVWVLLSNQSTAAVQVDVRPVLAGNILMTFQVPANGTVGIAPPLPLPGGADTGNAWTVDMPDITGTTVNITGLFTREI